jgi:hypothetical protein
MDAQKVVARFVEKQAKAKLYRDLAAFRYEPKESKQSKVRRLMRMILDYTGIGRRVAEDIADAILRNRDLLGLAVQKNWPMNEGIIQGPLGEIPVEEVRAAL